MRVTLALNGLIWHCLKTISQDHILWPYPICYCSDNAYLNFLFETFGTACFFSYRTNFCTEKDQNRIQRISFASIILDFLSGSHSFNKNCNYWHFSGSTWHEKSSAWQTIHLIYYNLQHSDAPQLTCLRCFWQIFPKVSQIFSLSLVTFTFVSPVES